MFVLHLGLGIVLLALGTTMVVARETIVDRQRRRRGRAGVESTAMYVFLGLLLGTDGALQITLAFV